MTPLVGEGVNREHSHGNASLNVAIREAIFGEIFEAEFPHGAVPIIAILDTGLEFPSSADPEKMLRRALIVRPSMVRPAHMQRAPGFIKPLDGHKNKQVEDVQRTRGFIWSAAERAESPGGSGVREMLKSHFNRVAEQIAFGHAHRLFSGGYFTSNLTIEGRLLDFGNSHVLPNWSNACVLDNDLGFGRDLDVLRTSVKSLLFYFSKYKPGHVSPSDEMDFMVDARRSWMTQFQSELRRLVGLDGYSAEQVAGIVNAIAAYFTSQQLHRVNYSRGEASRQGWFWEGDAAKQLYEEAMPAEGGNSLLHFIRSEYASILPDREKRERALRHTAVTGNRFLGGRESLSRDALQKKASECVGRINWSDRRSAASSVGKLISESIEQGRRHWRDFPSGLTVLAHLYEEGSTAIEAEDQLIQRRFYWLEGVFVAGEARLFQSSVDLARLEKVLSFRDKTRWQAMIPVSSWDDRDLHCWGIDIVLPQMRVRYDQGLSR
nr:hypothetical protein [uncultured Pseudoxanthomonas sp.]